MGTEVFSLGLKRLGGKAECLPPYIADVQNGGVIPPQLWWLIN
jgi:hypothetical protein